MEHRRLDFGLAAPDDVRCAERGAGEPYRVKSKAGTLGSDSDEVLDMLPDDRARDLTLTWRNVIARSYQKQTEIR